MDKYYLDQAGHGIPLAAFEGARFQRGHGFFGRLISRAVLPLLRYLGKKLFATGTHIYEDMRSGKDFGDSLKNRGLDALKEVADDGIEKLRQRGNGIKRRKRRRKINPSKHQKKSQKKNRKKKPIKRGKKKAKKTSRRSNIIDFLQ